MSSHQKDSIFGLITALAFTSTWLECYSDVVSAKNALNLKSPSAIILCDRIISDLAVGNLSTHGLVNVMLSPWSMQ